MMDFPRVEFHTELSILIALN